MLRQRVLDVLENKINIKLQKHQGWIELVDIKENKKVVVRFRGNCKSCGAVTETLNQFVIPELKNTIEEIEEVEIKNSDGVSSELVKLGKSLLINNKNDDN